MVYSNTGVFLCTVFREITLKDLSYVHSCTHLWPNETSHTRYTTNKLKFEEKSMFDQFFSATTSLICSVFSKMITFRIIFGTDQMYRNSHVGKNITNNQIISKIVNTSRYTVST